MPSLKEPVCGTNSPSRWCFRSRYSFVAAWFASALAGWFMLRVVVFAAFKPSSAGIWESLLAFLSGALRDSVAGAWLSLPILFWLLIVPGQHFRARWHRRFFWAACLGFWCCQVFLLFVEYFFFEEFRSRFNTVAVDYLQYPTEVFINIWDSYPVAAVMAICLVIAAAWVWAASRLFAPMWDLPKDGGALQTPRAALGSAWAWGAAAAVTILAWLAPLLFTGATLTGITHTTVSLPSPRVSADRTLNEIANNGVLSFFAAAWTRHLEYEAFYQTIPRDEAYSRTRRLLAQSDTRFTGETLSTLRQFPGDPGRPRLNVVLLLEESFGSEFWKSLSGRRYTATPKMDRFALRQGLLFTNIYASGNRTVRGIEGVLSSFPPLPGESIVRRNLSDNVESIARVLKRDGYGTVFLYGGRGIFDGLRSYALRNGYDRFIEQKHFANPTFTTIWGVCDEDLLQRTLQECRNLWQTGTPFFATALTVSNHKPYTYPKNRIPQNPDMKQRDFAVTYADYALYQFFQAARKEPFWTNTVFVVVADHGARAYGEQNIPIRSYEIPLLIVGPAVVKSPARIGQLGCSLDVAPTILGLIGRPYQSLFFGRDLLSSREEEGRALLNHNRNSGMLARDRLVVLGLGKTVQFYQGNPKQVECSPLTQPENADLELQWDTTAIYQVADELYRQQKYYIPEALPLQPPPASGLVLHP